MTEEMSSGVAWKLSGIHRSGWGWEVHSTSQERWMKTFWRVILSLSVMAPRGVAHSQISSAGDVDCHQWMEVGGCWASGCSICKHQCLELDASSSMFYMLHGYQQGALIHEMGGGLQKRTPISQSFSLYIHQLSYICTYVSVCVCENLS